MFGQSVLIEAESFDQRGGWKLDTQFIREMGSPYLLAHGLGTPVADATAKVAFPETGEYKVFVRTKDWVARWNAPGAPGRFQLLVNDKPLGETFGAQGAKWAWQAGGTVQIDAKEVELKLHDLTGFDGRCDAIFFTKEDATPPNESAILPAWRSRLLGLKEKPTEKSGYDLVVVGGGYAGMGAALSAARMGCKVALIQDRPVLGGNGSSEVRVWAMGNIRRGKFPRVGEIIEEFSDHAKKSPGTYEEFGDAKKEAVVRAEPNIDLFLNHHAYQVDMDGEKKIAGVYAFDTRTSEQKRFTGKLYVDCTGHGTIGFLAGADFDMAEKGRMGMSNMWAWDEADKPREFPATPWALDLTMKDFPYPRDHHGQWFWESGFDKDAIGDAEGIRDWNLRAVYGAFNAMKNKDGADKHAPAYLTWVAYVGGPRESRLLQGDIVLNQDDIISKRDFSDGCVPSTWSIDLHYPKKQFAEKFPDNPFISIAVHDQRVDRNFGYPVPYRCFYSRNIDNLFMAGRCISVDHEALGTVRVMKTCGMMGEVVGKAASICATYDCTPREVYERYWPEMDTLLKLPGKAHRADLNDEIEIPDDIPALAGPLGPPTGLDPNKLDGTVVDDAEAERIGNWNGGTGLKGYVGYGYLYAGGDSGGAVRFAIEAPESGVYDVRFAYQPHENRGKTVPVMVETKNDRLEVKINQQKDPPIEGGFISLGELQLDKGEVVTIVVATAGAGGTVHADAVQLVPTKK
ncbi:NADH-dependant oxidoreductase-like protein [Blastopirellula marina DSM 3645]|uniref:NADH-dependant oxidoreductase-like protein n=1 Tax=Blastopirellula marina DSM 3645 TaxID=314230 RepID=A3ZL26_9BACT|nr:NADH-dependant oxidoreductase-like protein [Blastopirellula marina DSM 3645]